jgi:hypothetical protein
MCDLFNCMGINIFCIPGLMTYDLGIPGLVSSLELIYFDKVRFELYVSPL